MKSRQRNPEDWPAPAKLNLFLHITGRRKDGYHLLQTVFQLLDYGDSLTFKVRDDGQIRRYTSSSLVEEQQDLTVRAAQMLQNTCQTAHGADIHLTKRLPMGGGLGGGSSDAATTLVVLNRLWRCGLSAKQLMKLGKVLGADVPVFIYGYSSWAEGIGERLQTLQLQKRWYVVIKPPVEVSTASIFTASELTRNHPPITIGDFYAGAGTNVFEPVVRNRYPEVGEALDWLNQQCQEKVTGARLTGTGSCVFAIVSNLKEGRSILKALPETWDGFVAQGVNRSPLLVQLDSRPNPGQHGQGVIAT